MEAPPEPQVVPPDDVPIPVDGRPPLRGWHWKAPDPVGVLVIAHGLGEHAGLYRGVAEYLCSTIQVDVLGFDFLGHGRSPGRRGHVPHYDRLIDDLIASTRWVAQHRPGLPRFVLGHSNGGLVSILSLLRNPVAADGLILSNPALRLKYRPPRHKLLIGHILRVIAPGVTLSGPLPVEDLTGDPLQRALFLADRLMHNRIGPPLFFGMRAGGVEALEHAPRMEIPLLILIGGADPIIDPDAGRSFFERYGGPDKSLLDEPEMRHDPLFERDRASAYRAVAHWIRRQVAQGDRTGRVVSGASTDGCD
jgi:alpha-beta hydrolase superfamily lysophospholipase